jgi:ribosome biogenesis protein MAK21
VHIFDLLKSKPEQEVNLLKLVVNKLGDLDRKVASKVSYLLLQLEQAHPAMKAIIVDAISELIFQQGASYHSRYYAVITLNQTVLAHKDTEVANSLMRVYLSLFERLLAEWDSKKPVEKEPEKKKKKPRWKNKGGKGKHGGERQVAKTSEELKEDESTKLTSAVLTGLNRAFPFSDLPKDKLDKHLDTLYRVTHSANFNTSVQALILIHQVSRSQALLSDRFYKTLYESLLDPRLAASSKLRLYFNLMFKALKEDADVARSKAFAKRLMQMATSWLNIGVVSAIIYLLQELEKSIPKLRELMSGDQETSDNEDKKEEYDGRKRDPQFANADSSKLWEVIPFLLHFHPTVTLYSEGYVNSDTSLVKPDLTLHTLSHFLDRFVYRNPKQKPSTKGDSIMQPLAGLDNRSNIIAGVRGDKTTPINMADWSGMKLSDIDVSERFFHQYFTSREGLSKSKKPKKMNDSEDEFDEDEVWKALVESRPDLEGEGSDDLSGFDDDKDGFSDEDIDFSDFSDDEVEVEGEDKESGSEKADVTAESDAEEDDEDDVAKSDDDEGMPDFEDSDAMLSSDAEIELDVLQSEVDEEGEETSKKGKRQHTGNDKKKSMRQRLKDLPEFASVEEYAEYLESSDEDYN